MTPIISQEIFDATQEAFASHGSPRRKRKHDFAFTGMLTCGRCGCSITAEIKKGKYVYYRCSFAKGKCGEPYLREEVLAEKLGEAVKGIQIGQEEAEWIKDALRSSHGDKKEFHKKAIGNLQAQHKKLQSRIDQAYLDKLDGDISEEFLRLKTREWKAEQGQILQRTQAHDSADKSYLEEGIQIFELANKAYSLYIKQSASEKARLLRVTLSNCTLENGTPRFEYKKPFDILAEGVKTENGWACWTIIELYSCNRPWK